MLVTEFINAINIVNINIGGIFTINIIYYIAVIIRNKRGGFGDLICCDDELILFFTFIIVYTLYGENIFYLKHFCFTISLDHFQPL